jgi:cytochrome c biogenesis protein CcdA
MERAPDVDVLLRLRWLQLRRAAPGYGVPLLVVAAVAAVWLPCNAVVNDASRAPYIAGGAVLLVSSLHQRRADLHFLHRHVQHARWAMVLEYGALVLPVLLGLMMAGAWMWAAVVLLACALPWLPVVRSSGVRAALPRKWVPAHLFEWRSMLQSTHPWSLLLWLAALAFCWLPLLPLFLVGIVALMAAGVQEQCEPRAMLLAAAPDARALLRKKVLGSVRIMLLLLLPVLIGATIFQPQWWWIHLLFGMGVLVLVAYAVVLKYAHYRPNERLTANGVNMGIAMVFAILPGLSLVPLIMLLSELRNARINLNTYFNAHHH